MTARHLGHLLLAFALLPSVAGVACKSRANADAAAQGTEPVSSTLPPLSIDDDTPDLLLTWIDAKGDAHTTIKPSDVPAEGRDQVRVVVTTKEEGTHDLFYVANLTSKTASGSYPVATLARSEWDAVLVKRRQPMLAASAEAAGADPNAPPEGEGQAPGSPGAGRAQPSDQPRAHAVNFTVIVYGASWCGACHQAMAYLKRKHIPAIEKDVEADARAQTEMQQKLARAGRSGGSIPVIDVKGTLLIGFEPHALDAAVRAASGETAL